MEKIIQPLISLWRDTTIALISWVLLAYLLDLLLSGFVQMILPLSGIVAVAGCNLLLWAIITPRLVARQGRKNVVK